MNENTKILFLAGLVLVVAIVSFNLDITGQVTDSCNPNMEITVSPTSLEFTKSGDHILEGSKLITVNFENVDGRGLDKGVDLYRVGTGMDEKVLENFMTICNRNICTEDSMKTERASANLVGEEYYLRATRVNDGCVYRSNTFMVA